MNSDYIIVLGAGVQGLSTAILLQKSGFKVKIIAEEDIHSNKNNPFFASQYPAASIIPHSVYGSIVSKIFDDSQKLFQNLYEKRFSGIEKHEHYEVFSQEIALPFYAASMEDFELFNASKSFLRFPSNNPLFGWKFKCYFADWSVYIEELHNLYLDLGGRIEMAKVELNQLNSLHSHVIINCTGAGSTELETENECLIVGGHLLKIKGAPFLRNNEGLPLSYNFTPGLEIYKNNEQEALDVYCYPRKDGWVLGGSRLIKDLSMVENADAEKNSFETIRIGEIDIPKPMIDLNKEIIEKSFGVTFPDISKISSSFGYRYLRNKEKGLRLEKSIENDKLLIHNYGHGGAGVTLSWGTALQILQWVCEHENITQPDLDSLF